MDKKRLHKKFQKNSQLVRFYMKPYWASILVAGMMVFLLGLVSALIVQLIGPALNLIIDGGNPNKLFSMVSLFGDNLVGDLMIQVYGDSEISRSAMISLLPKLLIIFGGMKAGLFLTQWYLWEKLGEKVSRDIRRDLIHEYLQVDPNAKTTEEGQRKDSDLSSNITNDVKLLREYIVRFYGGFPRELVTVIFLWVSLFILSKYLFVVFFLGVLPSVALISRLGKTIRKRANKALDDYSTLTEWLQQRLMGIETIKHYKTEDYEAQKMSELSLSLYQRFLKAARIKARTAPLIEMVSITAVCVVIYLAYLEIRSGALTGSVMMNFLATLGMLSQSAGKLGRYYNSNRDGAVAVDRIKSMFDFFGRHRAQRIEIPKAELPDKHTVLQCQGLSVSYLKDQYALKDFDFSFEQGKIYCICGASGAGKSTLFNAILGTQKLTAGELFFNEQNEFLKSHQDYLISYMPQQVLLMPGDIAQNISYPNESADLNKVEASLKLVGLWDDVQSMPQGMNTVIGEGGQGLSGGQAQRILLGRLWYHGSPVIMIDEGTSALDPQVEKEVYGFLHTLAKRGCTVIMIAHRFSAVKTSDAILLLEKGRLVESGDFDQVKETSAFKNVFGI